LGAASRRPRGVEAIEDDPFQIVAVGRYSGRFCNGLAVDQKLTRNESGYTDDGNFMHMHALGIIEPAVLIIVVTIFGRRRKPPARPLPSGDSGLLRRIRMFHKG
jgi:hypothetical protein